MSFPFLLITGNFSILYFCRIFSAFFISVPSGAVTKFSLVITSLTFFDFWFSKRRSRLVKIPANRCSLSTIGIPPILFSFINCMASPIVDSIERVTGSSIIPLSLLFTLSTCSAWRSMLIFLCRIPIPPSLAKAIANAASVTVSIAAESIGIFRRIVFVSWVLISTSRGKISLNAGTSKTSSKVKPSINTRSENEIF